MLNRAALKTPDAPLPQNKTGIRGRRPAGPAEPDILADRRRGRGAQTNISGRYETEVREAFDDEWGSIEELPPVRTEVQVEKARKIITRNQSPDISFDRSINPYRGCEHGCSYCFARPTHANMGLSPGLDFETKLFVKPDAAKLLEKELAQPGYEVRTIAIGTNTDPYQPIERQWRVMRQILEVLSAANHPVGIVTKSALVARDIDILGSMAERGLAKVALSLTTLDRKLARAMEPRAATPPKRLETMQKLAEAGIPVTVMTAPLIPALNDMELERLLEAGHAAGARQAGYVLLRLPLEVSADLPRVADRQLSRPLQPRHVGDAVDARRQGLRFGMGRAAARARPLCLDDRPALRGGGEAARPQCGAPAAAHRPLHAAGADRWTNGALLSRPDCAGVGRLYRVGMALAEITRNRPDLQGRARAVPGRASAAWRGWTRRGAGRSPARSWRRPSCSTARRSPTASPIRSCSPRASARRSSKNSAQCAEISFAFGSVTEIDRINILQATLVAMRRAVSGLARPADAVLVDGNVLPPGLTCTARAIIGGDGARSRSPPHRSWPRSSATG